MLYGSTSSQHAVIVRTMLSLYIWGYTAISTFIRILLRRLPSVMPEVRCSRISDAGNRVFREETSRLLGEQGREGGGAVTKSQPHDRCGGPYTGASRLLYSRLPQRGRLVTRPYPGIAEKARIDTRFREKAYAG